MFGSICKKLLLNLVCIMGKGIVSAACKEIHPSSLLNTFIENLFSYLLPVYLNEQINAQQHTKT